MDWCSTASAIELYPLERSSPQNVTSVPEASCLVLHFTTHNSRLVPGCRCASCERRRHQPMSPRGGATSVRLFAEATLDVEVLQRAERDRAEQEHHDRRE